MASSGPTFRRSFHHSYSPVIDGTYSTLTSALGPRFPRVSPAGIADPDAALDPGPANTFDLGVSVEF